MAKQENETCGNLISNSYGERYLYNVNRLTFDQFDASTLFLQRFGENLFAEETLHIIIGTDSGLLPNYILKQGGGDRSLYLLIELDEVKERLDREHLIQPLPSNIQVIDVDSFKKKLEDPELIGYFVTEKVRLKESFAACDANLAEYRQLCSTVELALKNKVLQLQNNINNSSFYEEQLKNLTENHTPAILLSERFKGKSAVILGGGPSLDVLLPWVLKNQDKLVILAASRISRRLIEIGLTPHIVLSIDPQESSFCISREMLLFPADVLFVHSNHVANQLCAAWRGRNLYLGPRYPWKSQNEPKNIDPWGPTVTNTSLGLAVAMGFSQIILIGVDFCYSSSGVTHAAGSLEHSAGPKLDESLFVTTNAGNSAETGPDYYSAMGHLEEQVKEARKQGVEVISPAPDAARIPNISFITTDKIVLEHTADSPYDVINKILPPENSRYRTAHYQQVLAELQQVQHTLSQLADTAKEAVFLWHDFTRNYSIHQGCLPQQLRTINTRLKNDWPELSKLIQNYNMTKFLEAKAKIQGHSSGCLLEGSDKYYLAWKQGAENLYIQLEEALKRTKVRLEEEALHPDFDLIFAQWQADKHWFRSSILQLHRPELAQTEPQIWSHPLTTWSNNGLKWSREYLDHVGKVPSRDLSRVRGKATNLFLQKDINSLERLFNGLSHHPNIDQAIPLQLLVKGYYCELQNNPEEALDCYQSIISDDFTPLTEEAFRRIAVVALQNGNLETAQLALECLSNASVNYKPRYADLLALRGQRQKAADSYIEYLEHVPTDIEVLLKLGKNYRAMGEKDAAQQVFELALEQQPDNSTALSLLKKNSN